jgi:pimeloyl-ACP methyl ester carboxylesterase
VPFFALLTALSCVVSAWGPELASAAEREEFQIGDNKAFVIMPPEAARLKGPAPWVWYAPTLGKRHPSRDEQWMIDRLHSAGIALAGIDVGESYGSPKGVDVYQAFYKEMTGKRKFRTHPVLLARSRGGLMLYSWAVSHANCVGGVAGIYPVCNIASYPGISRAAPAFGMTPEALKESLEKYNPVDNLGSLAKAGVPVFHLQGDSDKVVPHDDNSGLLETRYRALGGTVKIELIPGQGHNMWRGWFESESLTKFMIKQCLKD